MSDQPFAIDPDDIARAGLDLTEKASLALAQMEGKIEAARRQAFADGLDFACGPMATQQPSPFAIRDLVEPQRFGVWVRAGPCPRCFEPPAGWTVFRNPDYKGPTP